MGETLQQVFLSDVMIFMIMGFIMLLVTWWMVALREFAGYVLGWLVGIFLIIVISTLTTPPEPDFTITDQTVRLGFLSLMLPSAFGLAVGFGALSALRWGGYNEARVMRALTIAGLVSLTLIAWYFMLLTGTQTRLMIGIFMLTFAIGAMFSFILSRGSIRWGWPYTTEPPPRDANEPLNTLEMGDPVTPIDPPGQYTEQRVRNLRDRLRRRPPQ